MKESEWSDWPNFSYAEMQCSATGDNGMMPSFMDSLQSLRNKCGFPLTVSSGFRSIDHPIEAAKIIEGRRLGSHCRGLAADIVISGVKAHCLLSIALEPGSGFYGFGISQSGDHDKRFIHLDGIYDVEGFPRPSIWSY